MTQEAKGINENLSEFIKNSLNVSDIKETSDSKDESQFYYSLNMDGECWKTACSNLPGFNSNDTSQLCNDFVLQKEYEGNNTSISQQVENEIAENQGKNFNNNID